MSIPQAGEMAPIFTLKDQEGMEHSLKDYRGQWVLLYFYPKDSTPGCTQQACGVRDAYASFEMLDCVVLGVSADSIESHQRFVEKQNLPFTLLSDPEKSALTPYGVWQKKKLAGREYMGIVRTSFLIDPKGKIVKVYEKVKPATHASTVLEDLTILRSN